MRKMISNNAKADEEMKMRANHYHTYIMMVKQDVDEVLKNLPSEV
jgi:hypothetical protein